MEHTITIPYQARYFTHGNPQASHLVIALHGYGQLASYFIRKFESLDPEQYYVVVPEGLHRFYLEGTSGRVGASWMTKENRLTDIDNYLNYLDQLFSELTSQTGYLKKTLLGFSQGGATASRLIQSDRVQFDQFILWASVFPPDMDVSHSPAFTRQKNYLVIGSQDPYYSGEDIVKEKERLVEAGLNPDLINFDGKHTIDPETLNRILREI